MPENETNSNRCTYLTRKGNRCKRPRFEDSDLCYVHQVWLDRLGDDNAAGALADCKDLDNPEGIHRLMAEAMRGLAGRRISPRQASAVAYLGQVLLTSARRLEEYRSSRETHDVWEAVKEKAVTDLVLDTAIDVVDEEEQPEEEQPEEEQPEETVVPGPQKAGAAPSRRNGR